MIEKVVILHGSAVTQTMLGGQTTVYRPILQPKIMKVAIAVDKVIAIIIRLTFWPILYISWVSGLESFTGLTYFKF